MLLIIGGKLHPHDINKKTQQKEGSEFFFLEHEGELQIFVLKREHWSKNTNSSKRKAIKLRHTHHPHIDMNTPRSRIQDILQITQLN